MEHYLSDQNQLHIFDSDNFSISCKNADLSAVDNFFDNIAHPYPSVITYICELPLVAKLLTEMYIF